MKYGIIEDQTIFRQILREKLPGCVWEGRCLADLQNIPALDFLILDLELPDGNALDWLEKQRAPLPIIILSNVKEEVLVLRALKANASGLVHKEDSFETLLTAIDTVLKDGVFYSKTFQELRRAINANPDAHHKILTQREQEILAAIGQGFSNDEVAQILGLKSSSVSDHKTIIMRKLNINTSAELMRYAIAKGFSKVT